MSDQLRIKAMPQMQRQAQAPQEQVGVRMGSYGGAAPAGNSEMAGLLKGLSVLNPALQGYFDTTDKIANADAFKADTNAGKAFAANVQNPGEVLRGGTPVGPDAVPLAVSDTFRENMREVLAQRAGIENKTAAVAEYETTKTDPDFNPEQWLQGKRQEQLRGVTDPAAQAIIGNHATELESAVMADVGRTRVAKADAIRKSNVDSLAGNTFLAHMSGDQMQSAWPAFEESARKSGFTAPEAASMALERITYASSKVGGMPEMFDVFDRMGTNGQPIGGGPLLAHVTAARLQAQAQREKIVHEETEGSRADLYKGLGDDATSRPELVTWDRLKNSMGKNGLSAHEAASYWSHAQETIAKGAALESIALVAQSGALGSLPASKQTEYLEKYGKPLVDMMWAAKSPEEVAQAATRLTLFHTQTGASVPMDALKRRIETTVSNLPNANGASPAFLGMVEMYKALSATPQYRDMYFGDDKAKVMDAYLEGRNGRGEDEKTAYVAAYRTTTPEYKKAAEEYRKTPDFVELQKKDMAKYVTGRTWSPRWAGFEGTPPNGQMVSTWARENVIKFRIENPWAKDSDMEKNMEKQVARNWVVDKTSGLAVQVPPSDSPGAYQAAISSYTKSLKDTLNLDGMPNGGDIAMVRNGDQGNYSVYLTVGTDKQQVALVNMRDLVQRHTANMTLSDPEKAEVGRVKKLIASGGDLADADIAVLNKARGLNFLSERELQKVQDTEKASINKRLQAVPNMAFGAPDVNNLRFTTPRSSPVDYSATSRIAREFYTGNAPGEATAGLGATDSSNVTAALVTMGEGVMTKAYADPARGAGQNIGMGYNLKANAATARADLRRALVPEERIDDVLNGRAEMTEQQAKRLLVASLPRYASQAKASAEATLPGLWDNMTEAQRAVMTDVAYQVGSVDKFRSAWAALAKGDMAKFKDEIKVTYVDQSGTRKEDTRRNNIRAALLSGGPLWDSVIKQTGRLPSDSLGSLSLNKK